LCFCKVPNIINNLIFYPVSVKLNKFSTKIRFLTIIATYCVRAECSNKFVLIMTMIKFGSEVCGIIKLILIIANFHSYSKV